jgi:hypothetical protein
MPAVYLTAQDEEALRTFGRLRLQYLTDHVQIHSRQEHSLGCCGDCEQGLLNSYIDAIRQVLGRQQQPIFLSTAKVKNEDQLRTHLRSVSQMEEMFVDTFVTALKAVCDKLDHAVIQQNRTHLPVATMHAA